MALLVPAMGQSPKSGSKGENTEKKVNKGPKKRGNGLTKYQTFIYTSEDLSSEIERQVSADREALSRGLGADLLSAGLSAATGAATGSAGCTGIASATGTGAGAISATG